MNIKKQVFLSKRNNYFDTYSDNQKTVEEEGIAFDVVTKQIV